MRNVTKDDWLSLLGIPEDRIPQALVLRGTRNLRHFYDFHRMFFEDVIEVQSPNAILEDIFMGRLNGRNVAYASVYGAPMASEVVHLFGVLGTRLVIQTGCCGALDESLQEGDLFFATEAYRGEGASQYYGAHDDIVTASVVLNETTGAQAVEDVGVHTGRIYTTSALFAEGPDEIRDWLAMGCRAVDMETSAVFAVAEHFGMDRASVLFVIDVPSDEARTLATATDKDARRTLGDKRMIEVVLAALREGA